jgi:hypothetical protein
MCAQVAAYMGLFHKRHPFAVLYVGAIGLLRTGAEAHALAMLLGHPDMTAGEAFSSFICSHLMTPTINAGLAVLQARLRSGKEAFLNRFSQRTRVLLIREEAGKHFCTGFFTSCRRTRARGRVCMLLATKRPCALVLLIQQCIALVLTRVTTLPPVEAERGLCMLHPWSARKTKHPR